jgi:hypothetical protein
VEDQVPALSDRELLVRIDTKLDGVIEDKKDHEARIRALEDKTAHFVTGKQLWIGFTSAVAVASVAFPAIQWVINK